MDITLCRRVKGKSRLHLAHERDELSARFAKQAVHQWRPPRILSDVRQYLRISAPTVRPSFDLFAKGIKECVKQRFDRRISQIAQPFFSPLGEFFCTARDDCFEQQFFIGVVISNDPEVLGCCVSHLTDRDGFVARQSELGFGRVQDRLPGALTLADSLFIFSYSHTEISCLFRTRP